MRLGVDLSPFYTESKYRGIGRYARGLLQELIRIDEKDQFHFLNIYGAYEGEPPMNQRCFLHQYPCGPKIEFSGGKLLLADPSTADYLHAAIDQYLRSSRIDAMLFLSMMENNMPFQVEWFSGVTKIGILYDLIPLVFSEEYLPSEKDKQHYLDTLEFAKQMDLLLAISETTKNDAVRLLGISEEKIVVINAGVDEQFLAAAEEAHLPMSQKLEQDDPYILFIGGMDSRKNIEKAIQAFAINRAAREKNIRFVIAGRSTIASKASFIKAARRYGANDRVVFPGYVRDEDMVALYKNALALLFPSLYEGFGLPVLEAMCSGTAVITSNTSSLAEVAQGYAYLVDPENAERISDGITALLKSGEEAEAQICRAKRYATAFCWRRVAEDSRNAILSFSERAKPAEHISKPFHVEAELLDAIANLHTQFFMPFTWMNALTFAKQMRRFERGIEEDGIRQGSRILYDVSRVCAEDCAGGHAAIDRISGQLMRALTLGAEVVPVKLKREQDSTSFVRMDMKTCREDGKIVPDERDVYLQPDWRMSLEISYGKYARTCGIKTYAIVYELPSLPDDSVEKALRDYDGILTVSNAVADELYRLFSTSRADRTEEKRPQIGVFPLGADHLERQGEQTARVIQRLLHGKTPIFLMVDDNDLDGEQAFILQAFRRLWQSGTDCKLCVLEKVVSEKSVLRQRARGASLGRNVVYLDHVDSATLLYAYRHATALIESDAEGGCGLPILEAASNRLPILCSDNPVLHEIAGEHAIYFSLDAESLAQRVGEALQRLKTGEMPDSGKIDLFTWDEAATSILSMILEDKNWTYRG